jgi:hypothetical protein
MWEITLIGQKEDYVYFVLLEDMLSSILREKPIVAISGDNRLVCSIAIRDKSRLRQVKKCIVEIIIKICKEEYFREKLDIDTDADEDMFNFVLLSLIMINLHDEVDYSCVKLSLSKTIHIRSLVRFKLNKLYTLWDRFIRYFNKFVSIGRGDEIYLQILKFIANCSGSSNEIMYLEDGQHEMRILDKNQKLLSAIPKSDEIGVIVNLIVLSPKKLIINCYDCLSHKVAGLIQYIFGDKLSILF